MGAIIKLSFQGSVVNQKPYRKINRKIIPLGVYSEIQVMDRQSINNWTVELSTHCCKQSKGSSTYKKNITYKK